MGLPTLPTTRPAPAPGWRGRATACLQGLLLVLAAAALPQAGASTPRLALVIGNGAYASSPLVNPPADAQLTARALQRSGFEVTVLVDADRRRMETAVRDFARRLKAAGPKASAVFYYAGHGVQVGGRNYLIPVGAPIDSAVDLPYAAVEAQWALDIIGDSSVGMSVFILDACRNNPFRSLSRAASAGLARMDAPRGAILSYSTAPGEVAEDGLGGNSPYTRALADAIGIAGLKIEETFKVVRRAVLAATGGRQTPWESSSLVGDFYFTPGLPLVADAAPAATPPEASRAIEPGARFRDCDDCPEMVVLPAGEVLMGSAPGWPDHEKNEAPVARVVLGALAFQRLEVTRGEYARFLGETGHAAVQGCDYLLGVWLHGAKRNWRNTGYAQNDDHPVVCVRWADAVSYAEWLSRRTGKRYRLPSEAEWEYAAGQPPWGADLTQACAYGNLHDSTAHAAYYSGFMNRFVPCTDAAAGTVAVGSHQAGAHALSDMYGNAMEWTQDCWNTGHAGRPPDASARRDGDCGQRVVKGGHFVSDASTYRPAWRLGADATRGNIYLGFRLVRDID